MNLLELDYFAEDMLDNEWLGQDNESLGQDEAWLGEVNRRSRPYIRWVQRSLNQIIGARLSVDGRSGRNTRRAVKNFQSRQGLGVDGIVGPQTEAALVAAGAARPPGSTSTPHPSPPPSGGFRLVSVEVPGGRRIKDKRDPDPSDVVIVKGKGGKSVPLHRLAADAWKAMVRAARADGLADPLLLPTSGYRGSKTQERLWKRALKKYGSANEARKWVAPPGGSAHQSGRAIDFYLGGSNSSSNVANLRKTSAYKWLVKNAQRFGFYPYTREPWHWEYNPPAAAREYGAADEFNGEWDDEWDGEGDYEVNRRSRAYIRWLQQALNKIIRAGLAVDGISGSRTRAAVRNFQRKAGLATDGIVGPNTERALIDAGSGIPPGGTSPTSPSSPSPAPSGGSLRSNIARVAVQEWQRWGKGTRKESDARMRPILEDYWRTGVGWLPSQSSWWSNVAWSAAFISWVVRQAGAGSAFHYSARHTDYVGAAKRNRVANNSNPFKAYRTSERAPRVGDLVCKSRSNSGVTYDNVDKGSFASHCDIVVEVSPGQIKTIGGNVSNTVKRNTVPTDSKGRIRSTNYYAIVRVGA